MLSGQPDVEVSAERPVIFSAKKTPAAGRCQRGTRPLLINYSK